MSAIQIYDDVHTVIDIHITCDCVQILLTVLANLCWQVSPSFWNAGKNNMGFGMDRYTWNTIKGCQEVSYSLSQVLVFTI